MSTLINPLTYVPKEPVTQQKGIDPISLKLMQYKVDADNVIVARYNDQSASWVTLKEYGFFPIPDAMMSAITEEELDQLCDDLDETEYFAEFTEYIYVGDEPRKPDGSPYPVVFDLQNFLGDSYPTMLKFLSMMPRQMLFPWFNHEIRPALAKGGGSSNINLNGKAPQQIHNTMYGVTYTEGPLDQLMWGAFIELFNRANIDHCNKNKISPQQWEDEKLESYYIAQSEDTVKSVEEQISSYKDIDLADDPKAVALIEEYAKLPKIGDQGLEINRQSAVRELLRQKEYEAVRGIIDAFKYAKQSVIGESITQPIPFDIVSEDGKAVRATGG